jgi:curved DNA-binding protein CbpA
MRSVVTVLSSVLIETLVEHPEERLVLGGTANLTRNAADFPGSLRQVLEALEEQVVVLKLLAAAQDPGTVTVRIGEENESEQMRATSVVSIGYGASTVLGGMGVVGRPGWTIQGTIAAVHAVARYVGEILAGANSRSHARQLRRTMGNAGVARDYYGILGVGRDAGPDEIKRAYRRLARELHPDVNPDAAAQERFAEVSAAYEVLSDPEKRRIVDLGGDPLGNGGAGAAGADPFSAFGLGDIMDAFFGGGAAGGRSRGPRSRVQPGADALIRMQLTLEECASGVTRDLAVTPPSSAPSARAPAPRPAAARPAATSAVAAARCRACSARSSARWSPAGRARTAAASARSSPSPCRQCGGDGRVRSRRTSACGSRPGSRTACGCGSPTRARSARAVARRATCTSRWTRCPTRSSRGTARTCTARSSYR